MSPNNNPVPITFQAPVATGSQPVQATCTPASGSLFAVGTTAVGCSAATSETRVSCTFNVTVAPPPRLEKTRTLAFGDSITFGSSALCAGAVASQRWTPAELLSPWSNPVPSPTAYPGLLQTMLRDRYTAQQPIVVNAGLPGEAGNDSETRRRFTRTLNENAPEVLLLQEGINDLHSFGFYGIPTTQGIARLVDALRGMALDARGRGIRVFLATLLPQRPNGCRAYAIPPRGDEDLITPTNNLIRSMASAENIDLIDLATLFQPQLETLIGPDGLHPTAAGYTAIANAFFEAMRRNLEAVPSAAGNPTQNPP